MSFLRFCRVYSALLFAIFAGLPVCVYFPSFSLLLVNEYLSRAEPGKGILLPILFLPLSILVLLSLKPLVQAISQKLFFYSFLSVSILFLISVLNGQNIYRAVQITLAISLLSTIPFFCKLIKANYLVASVIALTLFSVIHFLDQISTYGNLKLGSYTYPYIFSFHIYGAEVSFPDIILLIAASAFMLSDLGRCINKNTQFLMKLAAFELIFYSITFTKGSTMFSLLLFIISFFLVRITLFSFRSRKYISKSRISFILLSLIPVGFLFPYIVNIGRSGILKLYSRIVIQQGFNRSDIWIEHLNNSISDPISFAFGSNYTGAHNFLLELLCRVGIIGLLVSIFAFTCSIVFIRRRTLPHNVNLDSTNMNPGIFLAISVIISGNMFNESLTQLPVIACLIIFFCSYRVNVLARISESV